MSIKKEIFGKLEDGREVFSYVMKAECGIEITVLNLGGIIQSLKIPGKDGKIRDIVCGYDTPDEYIKNSGYCGALIGRYANRIDRGVFILDGKEYNVSKNEDGIRTLHGGFNGFDKKIWDVEAGQCGCGADRLRLYCVSEDGEEGFPGKVDVKVVIRLSPEGELAIRYFAEADKRTPIGMTNHCYFNLDGYESGNVKNHFLALNAKKYVEVDEGLIPEKLSETEGTLFDFTKEKKIGEDMDFTDRQIKNAAGFDHSFEIDENGEHIAWNHGLDLTKAAVLRSEKSGICMSVYTDAPAIQVYTGNYMYGVKYKNQVEAQNHGAVCLEPGFYPDSPNRAEFPDCIFGPERPYSSTSVYRFVIS